MSNLYFINSHVSHAPINTLQWLPISFTIKAQFLTMAFMCLFYSEPIPPISSHLIPSFLVHYNPAIPFGSLTQPDYLTLGQFPLNRRNVTHLFT